MLNVLNDDNLKSVFLYLDVADILIVPKICGKCYHYFRSDNMIYILSIKLNMVSANLEQLLLRYHRSYITPLLNIMVQIYYRFDNGIHPITFINYNNKVVEFKDIIDRAFKNNGRILRAYPNIDDVETTINDISEIKDEDVIGIHFDQSYATKQLNIHIGFKIIIIDFSVCENEAIRSEVEDFNSETPFILPSPSCYNIKPYIQVNDTTKQIIISSDMKKSPLVMEDILHTISLVQCRYRTYGSCSKYIISNENTYDILHIQLVY